MYAKRVFRVVFGCVFCVGGLLSVTGAAHAGGTLVGTSFGFTHYAPENGDGLSAISLPYQGSLFGTFQPGLRIGGFVDEDRRHEIFADTGVSWLSGDGFTFTSIQLMGGYQHCFSAGPEAPYVNIGVGMLHIGGDDDSINAMVVGGGFGVRHVLANGHGAVRGEFRLDHQFEGKRDGAVVLDAINAYGVKFGFDLYLN